jgi:hypothetical protein
MVWFQLPSLRLGSFFATPVAEIECPPMFAPAWEISSFAFATSFFSVDAIRLLLSISSSESWALTFALGYVCVAAG